MQAYRYTVGLRSILLAIAGEGESERYLLIRERGSVMKYQITLEVESEWELDQLIRGQHGALVFAANHPWKVLEAFKREDK